MQHVLVRLDGAKHDLAPAADLVKMQTKSPAKADAEAF